MGIVIGNFASGGIANVLTLSYDHNNNGDFLTVNASSEDNSETAGVVQSVTYGPDSTPLTQRVAEFASDATVWNRNYIYSGFVTDTGLNKVTIKVAANPNRQYGFSLSLKGLNTTSPLNSTTSIPIYAGTTYNLPIITISDNCVLVNGINHQLQTNTVGIGSNQTLIGDLATGDYRGVSSYWAVGNAGAYVMVGTASGTITRGCHVIVAYAPSVGGVIALEEMTPMLALLGVGL